MRRYWEVEYSNGTIIKEGEQAWKKIPKINMIRLTLHYDGRRWDLHNKTAYLQKKRGSIIPNIPESFCIESRSIGYYETNQKVWFTVDEATGRMTLEVEEI